MSAEPRAQVLKALDMAHSAPRCGARCRRNGGAPCRGPAIKGKARCRMHGGRSTGPSVEGRQKLAAMCWKHGHRSKAATEARAMAVAVRRELNQVCVSGGRK
jgi:hypothetical protein